MVLKIAHMLAYPYHGGLQEYALNLASTQVKLGHDVTIYAAGLNINKGGKIRSFIRKPFATFFRNPISLSLVRDIINENYDVVHVHLPFPVTGDLLILLKGLLHFRSHVIVATYHFDIDLQSSMGRLIAFIYKNVVVNIVLYFVDGIIITSRTFMELSPILRKHQNKISVKPIGIDSRLYKPVYSYPPRVLFVGRVIPEKGIHYLIQALKYTNPEIELFVVGQVVDYKYYKYLCELTRALNLSDRVYFKGLVSQREKIEIYGNSGVVVLPSTTRLESFGISLLEGMASGKPVIATDMIPGAVNVIKNCGCGVLVPPRNPLKLAEALKSIFDNGEASSMGRKARKYVEENCDWETIANEVVEIYNKIIIEKNTSGL